MSYAANVIKVMIASPGDVGPERQSVREVIHEWNAMHAEDKKLVLMPISWESHASPKMGASAQNIINAQVLKDCDLLVAVFWTRLGSPTGESPSGTVDEINKHIEAGKPAMIYFSKAPVHPDSIDSEQYHALVSFRSKCEKEGLIEKYDSISEFRDKLMRQLTFTIHRDFTAENPVAESELKMLPAQSVMPPLSDEARQLLDDASKDTEGGILVLRVNEGMVVSTNGKQLVDTGNPRSEAKWEGAIEELVGLGLLVDRGNEGEVFKLTSRGFDLAEIIKQQ
jgi:hypothetical protein